MRVALLLFLSLVPLGEGETVRYFTPSHRVSGIGVGRDDISSDLLERRTDLMVQSQTFSIMREAQAVPGAERITGNSKLQSMFHHAAAVSGWPVELIEAIAYLESWGEVKAESPTGPKGIMQISAATARAMGLRVVVVTRYRVTREKVLVPAKKGKKPKYRTVTHKIPYLVTVRDDRLSPDRAIPAAAVYLANMERHFGGRDWAVFAYHCGPGCVTEMLEMTRRARGIPKDEVTVPRMFFSCSPAWNRELYDAVHREMQRDYSPTYYFRVMRAEQLLALYRRDPQQFRALSQEYKSEFVSTGRAPHRLAVWLKRDDLMFHSCEDLRAASGKSLVRAFDRPDYFGYLLRLDPGDPANLQYYSQAAPSAVGTLMYISFETRRLFDEMKPRAEKFQPLKVTSLVDSEDRARLGNRHEALAHCSGQVFDVDYTPLPAGELECLRFVLSDLGWDGYLGFVEDGAASLHIGCSPSSRDFFTTVFQEAVE